MNQAHIAVDVPETKLVGSDVTELVFLDDASYALVGGGDAVNGY